MGATGWIFYGIIAFFSLWIYFTVGYVFAKWNLRVKEEFNDTRKPSFASCILFPASSYSGDFITTGILPSSSTDAKEEYITFITIIWPIKFIANLIIGLICVVIYLSVRFPRFIGSFFSYPARKLTDRNAKFWL
jgi:hypothetical protein